MPPASHLEWFDITDFTPGLHGEVKDGSADARLVMPVNAATIMQDCYPLPQGGIRAAWRPTTISNSGIDTAANEVATGIGNHSSLPNRTPPGNSPDRYLTTIDVVAGQEKIYRMDETAGASVWSQETGYDRTDANVTTAGETSIFPFVDVDGVRWMVIVLRSGNEPGFYKIKYALDGTDGDLTKINTWFGPAIANQARVIIGETASSDTLKWTDEGTLTPSSSELQIAPYQDGFELRAIAAVEPSDLLIAREGAAWVNIAGDITSAATPVREMGFKGIGQEIQTPARTPSGLAFIDGGGRIYVTDGRQFQDISKALPQFYRSETTGVRSHGRLLYANHFLFAPGGFVRDWETGAWFTLSDVDTEDDAAMFWSLDLSTRIVWCVTEGPSFRFRQYRPFDTDQENRIGAWTWQSAPFSRADARSANIREVQVFLQANANSTLAVTRTGADGDTVTRTSATLSSGAHMVSFRFPNTGHETQKIKLVATAVTSTNEAPTVERIRVGMSRDGNRRY